MDKGKGVVMNRRWAIDFTDNSTVPSSRDIPDPPGFSRAPLDQDDSTLSRQKKDAEANWKSQSRRETVWAIWGCSLGVASGVLGMGVARGGGWGLGCWQGWVSKENGIVGIMVGFQRNGISKKKKVEAISSTRQKMVPKSKFCNVKDTKAWEMAQAPFKNLLMMGFMMWMAGSTVHLFSIGITFSALWQPISALQGVGKVFAPYKDSKVDLLAPKLLFIALNLGGLALGVWKLNSLGLLPTHASDWVSSLSPAQRRLSILAGVCLCIKGLDQFDLHMT
ncbi:unnamed protein product [Camellia sinensis]